VSSLPNEFQRISAGVYAFKRIVPVEDLLAQIGRDLEIERALSQEDRQGIAKAYDSLLDDAVTEVIVPTDEAVSPSDTTLGKIVNSLNARAREYGAAVSEFQCSPDDQRVLNEVLRIAYNFSTDVLPRRLKRQPYARRNFCAPQGWSEDIDLVFHRSNGKNCQLSQPPLKCFPITLYFWVVFSPPCRPHQDVDDLFHSEPLRRPSDLPRFLERSQKLCEAISVSRIQIADPGPRQLGESLLQFRHVLRLAEKLEPHSKVSIEQPC